MSSSTKTSEESPGSPTSPGLPPPVASFPPVLVTADNVRNKCRELLVAALQTGGEEPPKPRLFLQWAGRVPVKLRNPVFSGDHLALGVDCQHLAAQIEEDILQPT